MFAMKFRPYLKADGAPPIVECPDGLDFEIGCEANQVGPGVGYNDNPEVA